MNVWFIKGPFLENLVALAGKERITIDSKQIIQNKNIYSANIP